MVDSEATITVCYPKALNGTIGVWLRLNVVMRRYHFCRDGELEASQHFEKRADGTDEMLWEATYRYSLPDAHTAKLGELSANLDRIFDASSSFPEGADEKIVHGDFGGKVPLHARATLVVSRKP